MTIGDAPTQQERGVLRLDLGRQRHIDGAAYLICLRKLCEGKHEPQLQLRGVGGAEPFDELVVVLVGSDRSHGHSRDRGELGVGGVVVQHGPAAGLRFGVVALDGQHADHQAAKLGGEVRLAFFRCPTEIAHDRPSEIGDAVLQRLIGGPVDQSAETAQTDGDALPDSQVSVAMKRFGKAEEIRRRQPAADDGVPRIVDEVVAIDHREAREGVAIESGAQRVVVRDSHESVTACIDQNRCAGRWQRDARLRRIEQQLRLDSIDREVDRHDEDGRIVGVVVGEPLLVQHQLRTVEAGRDQRIPWLPDPRIHQVPYWHAGVGLLDRVPQITGLGVAVRVGLQVQADSLAELLDAEVLLEHS